MIICLCLCGVSNFMQYKQCDLVGNGAYIQQVTIKGIVDFLGNYLSVKSVGKCFSQNGVYSHVPVLIIVYVIFWCRR